MIATESIVIGFVYKEMSFAIPVTDILTATPVIFCVVFD
jgi:hypothetical protein